MITTIFQNGTSFEKELKPINELSDIGVIFDSIEARDKFCAQFPKSLKVRCAFIESYEGGKSIKKPYASAQKMSTKVWYANRENKVTGSKNESGDKRIIRFYEALKNELKNQEYPS